MPNPWEEIAPAADAGHDNVRRADASHPLEFWRGRDSQGRYVFALTGKSARKIPPSLASIGEVEVLFSQDEPPRSRLSLILKDARYRDVYRALCQDLLSATRSLEPGEFDHAVDIIGGRLRSWQLLMSRSKNGLLSPQEVIGLVGELLFLRDVLMPRMDKTSSVSMWRGPFGDEQDFVVNDTIFEIKSQLVTSDARLQISSEAQLDTSSGNIIVCRQTLTQGDSLGAHTSLNGIVAGLKGELSAPGLVNAFEAFEACLGAAGYASRGEFDSPLWAIHERTYYRVEDGFPRLSPSNIPPGVSKVRYQIDVSACAAFRTDEVSALECLGHGKN